MLNKRKDYFPLSFQLSGYFLDGASETRKKKRYRREIGKEYC
jgi:hypothetical protein